MKMIIRSRRGTYLGKMPKITHDELVNRAFSYLKMSMGCSVVFKERKASVTEEPDAIGFKQGFSYLIECKASRADFLSDKNKPFRKLPASGMGYHRYYMAPVGMLEPSEIPTEWGLLEVYEKPPMQRSRTVKIAKESVNFYIRNLAAEVSYLVSAIRRLDISMQLRNATSFFVKGEPIKAIEIINGVIKDMDCLRSSTTSKESNEL